MIAADTAGCSAACGPGGLPPGVVVQAEEPLTGPDPAVHNRLYPGWSIKSGP